MNKYLLGLLMVCGCCLAAAEPLKVSCTTYYKKRQEITTVGKDIEKILGNNVTKRD